MTVRYRLRRRQLPWFVVFAPVFVLLGEGMRSPGPAFAVAAGCLVLVVAQLAWLSTVGVELRPDALVARGLRVRVVPWHEIGWIGVTPFLGARTVGVRTHDGRLLRLRAPTDSWAARDPEFEQKLRTITEYWQRVTSAGCAP